MYSFNLYNKSYFDKILIIFLKFQKNAKIRSMFGEYVQKSPLMTSIYLKNKLNELIFESTSIYVGLRNNEPYGIVFFKNDILTLVFKDPNFTFDSGIKQNLLDIIQDYKDKHNTKVFAYLGQRKKFEKYIQFMKKKFDISVKGVDNFGKVIIEFL